MYSGTTDYAHLLLNLCVQTAPFRGADPPEPIVIIEVGQSSILDLVDMGEKYKALYRGYVACFVVLWHDFYVCSEMVRYVMSIMDECSRKPLAYDLLPSKSAEEVADSMYLYFNDPNSTHHKGWKLYL